MYFDSQIYQSVDSIIKEFYSHGTINISNALPQLSVFQQGYIDNMKRAAIQLIQRENVNQEANK